MRATLLSGISLIARVLLLNALFMLSEIRGEEPAQPSAMRLSICYNTSIPPAQFAAFNLLVLDSAYPEKGVKQLRDQGKTVIGYMSLGAVGKNRWWFEPLAQANALRGQNPGFASHVIKLDNPLWKKLVTQRIIPEIIKKGFNGIFLDDLDLIYQTHQQRAAAELIAEIRVRFPELKIMANRGLEYLKDFSKQVDYVLLESCVTADYKLSEKTNLQWAEDQLESGKKSNPNLIACALDYYAKQTCEITAEKAKLITAIRRIHLEQNFVSCISVESLAIVPIKP